MRVIPMLLLGPEGLVKTVKMEAPRYIGDPINAVRIFTDKAADEIIIIDREASAGKPIRYGFIETIVSEALMPVAYAGGVQSVEQAARLLQVGVEKIVLNAGLQNPDLLPTLSARFGASTMVAAVDIQKNWLGKWRVHFRQGKETAAVAPAEFCRQVAAAGAGEILLHAIGHDGCMQGYPIEVMSDLAAQVPVPVIAAGGAGSLQHMQALAASSRIRAFAAGSLFVYYGPHRAVLINYPEPNSILRTFAG
ncbi:MAG: HisA/HisF-related TIM barrel protein [Chitinophagaceae bacterium]|nr:HisA/HisF-related TIM barrel protein [Chitinophagaceae bacterium]